jgi:hypothetical protein
MSHEHRRHRRYDVEGVRGSLLYSLDARILNMSLTGMAIETSSLLKVGGSYWLRVPHEEGGQLRFKAEVKWCHLVRNERGTDGHLQAVYQAGIDFRDILDSSALQVLQFLERHMVVELDRRLSGRFQLAHPREAAIAVRHEFEVRRLSIGGMAVETEWEPEVDLRVDLELGTGAVKVQARGRVRSVRPADPGPEGQWRFSVGLEFVEVSPEDRKVLSGLLETFLE